MSLIHITDENFEQEIGKHEGKAIVDFWAPWCGPCMMLGPIFEQFANEADGKAVVGKLNVDDCQDLAVRFGVMTIPTIIIFNNGEEVDRLVGVQPKEKLLALL